eukprot:TRINITY_DN28539_c0_g1_i1.p1 TRINITY_DN28539_c0_g1~~TRINITY_DN28539_c0_g1_i1.p1  ORF type:complete len:557 (-),score=142.29 TRINITY_DN28539_c0_g1_i1:77-1726(-)
MPIDPSRMRRVVEENDALAENIKKMSETIHRMHKTCKLGHVEPQNFAEMSAAAKAWSENVKALKESLHDQSRLSRDMRENARIQEEQHSDMFRDRYRFVVDRLKFDIRYYFNALSEFMDLPQDFSHQVTWEHCVLDMEKGMKSVNAPANDLSNLEPIVMLLNMRDSVISMLLNGLLYRAALLHWDMDSKRTYADGPMVAMTERIVNSVSKTETVHDTLEDLPSSIFDRGPFSFDTNKESDKRSVTTLTPLQCRLLTLSREMQVFDQGIRSMTCGMQVSLPDTSNKCSESKNAAAEGLRAEVMKWNTKFVALERELQTLKFQKHNTEAQQVERLAKTIAEKEHLYRQQVARTHKLEGEVQSKVYENTNLKREKGELADKNTRMKDNLPLLEKMEKMLDKSSEAVERLNADSILLSPMFQIQSQQNNRNVDDRNEISQELSKVHRLLNSERAKMQAKQEEVRKKETLYLRTMAARKSIHESYLERKAHIQDVEEKMQRLEVDRQELIKVVEGRDSEIKQLRTDLRRAAQRIEELEQHGEVIEGELIKATIR